MRLLGDVKSERFAGSNGGYGLSPFAFVTIRPVCAFQAQTPRLAKAGTTLSGMLAKRSF